MLVFGCLLIPFTFLIDMPSKNRVAAAISALLRHGPEHNQPIEGCQGKRHKNEADDRVPGIVVSASFLSNERLTPPLTLVSRAPKRKHFLLYLILL